MGKVEIIGWDRKYRDDFVRLNRRWIETYFALEPCDLDVFADPEGRIVNKGGQVFFAVADEKVIGCCALIRHTPERYELAKMAVSPDAQGHGTGRLLAEAVIAKARSLNATELFLEANTRLERSVRLYRSLGFKPADTPHAAYKRCDLFMIMNLKDKEMSKIYHSLTELIGHTPLLELSNIEKKENLTAKLIVKLESFNPGGSVKDRPALNMIEAAEKAGKLVPGQLLIEPTSGNMGIGLAWIATVKGYKIILTMPETMSLERRKLLKALGADIVLTPGKDGMKGAINKALELQKSNPGSFIPSQFDNPANPEIHYVATGEEIWNDTNGNVDIIIAGVGTGGTISGTAKTLKAHKKDVFAIAVEPASSPVLSGGKPGTHKIQGIGAGFEPVNFKREYVDEILTVKDEDAFRGARLLAKHEGVLAGISSGAAFHAALQVARRKGNEGKTIVAVLPDTGERYLSTPLFDYDNLSL